MAYNQGSSLTWHRQPPPQKKPFRGSEKCIGTYTDQELDKETGLYNYNARLYDPAVGIFISPDNIVPDVYDPQSLNRFAYARNNPLKYIDPTGHWYNDVESDPSDYDKDYNNNNNGSFTDVDKHDVDDPGEKGWAYSEDTGWVNHNLDAGKQAAQILGEAYLTAIPIAHFTKIRYLSRLKWWGKAPKIPLTSKQQKAISKINNALRDPMKPHDISGAVADQMGSPIPKRGGGYWNHAKEMQDTLRGLRKNAATLKGVTDPGAQAARQRALESIKTVEEALKGAGI